MLRPEQPGGAALADRLAEALDRQRVLGAAVHVAFGRADRVGGDEHALDDAEGVALEHRAVHERAGVALVGVADEVLLAARLVEGDLPLLPGREAGAAAAAQAGGDDLVADLGRGHRRQRPGGGAEAAGGQRRIQAGRVDDAAVGEHHLGLPGEERRVADRLDTAIQVVGVVVAAEQEAVVQLPVAEHGLKELVDRLGAEVAVAEPDAVGGHQVDEDLALAVAHAAGLDDRHVQAAPLEEGVHLLDDGERAVGAPAGAGADVEDHPVAAAAGALEARRPLLRQASSSWQMGPWSTQAITSAQGVAAVCRQRVQHGVRSWLWFMLVSILCGPWLWSRRPSRRLRTAVRPPLRRSRPSASSSSSSASSFSDREVAVELAVQLDHRSDRAGAEAGDVTTVKRPSAELPSARSFSRRFRCWASARLCFTWHAVPRQSSITCSPSGAKRNWL